jgi:hypothetical protein
MIKRCACLLQALLAGLLLGFSCDSDIMDTGDNWSRSVESLRKVDDFPFYVMRFYGGYFSEDGFSCVPHSMKETPAVSYSPSLWGCTCFSAMNSPGHIYMGRNFDWGDHPVLLLFTDPPEGYASVSMVDISYLGYSKQDSPVEQPDALMNAPYYPFDGLNEHGLCVGIMAVPDAEAPLDKQKPTVGCLTAIRIILDNARNVDEAIQVFHDYNIDFTGGPPLHYFLMDASRNSAVIEFVDYEISVLRNSHPWQVATNFTITGLSEEEMQASCWRYDKAWDELGIRNGTLCSDESMQLLNAVSQYNTIWSVVYDALTGDIHVSVGRKYMDVHDFKL